MTLGLERAVITQTSFRDFKNCRRLDYWKNEEKLVSREEKAETLRFGGLIHEVLETWYRKKIELDWSRFLRQEALGLREDRDLLLQAQAMFQAYRKHWEPETMVPIVVEPTFQGEIMNPDTGRPSRTHVFAGKADMVAEENGKLWLVEHKTVSQTIDQGYLEKLWTDEQVALYIAYLESPEDQFEGVIYNVLGKSRLKRLEPNSRRSAFESDDEYLARLENWYAEEDRFHRQRLLISRNQIEELKRDLWDITQERLACRKSGRWYQNRDHCFSWGRACSYLALCRSGSNPVIKENLYRRQEPHEELRGSATE